MFVVGLTGGAASGKTTVAGFFSRLGAPVIDADEAARAVVAPGAPGLAAVTERFGASVLNQAGALDRPRMRALVFADANARRALEAIIHPRVRAWMTARLDALQAPYAILCIPLLVESGGGYPIDRIVVVDCAQEQQVARLTARDHCSEQQARAMLAAQCPREQRLAVADDVIENSGDPQALERQVQALHEAYLALAG